MVRQPNGFSIPFILLFVKCSHALRGISVDLNWSVINLRHSLKLNIISPYPELRFPRTILLNWLVRNKALEVILPNENILQAPVSDNLMLGRVAINLVCNSMKQAVPITCHFYNLKSTLLAHFLFKS